MILPPELLLEIASYLSARDLTSCRSACRSLAELGRRLIPRNGLTMLDTSEELHKLHKVLNCAEIASFTQQLTIYPTTWNNCDYTEWKTHYLTSDENFRARRNHSGSHAEAYVKYKIFMEMEQRRTNQDDVKSVSRVLQRLPHLKSLHICHLRCYSWNPFHYRKFKQLQMQIGVSSGMDIYVQRTVYMFLVAICIVSARVKTLSIKGVMDLSALRVDWSRLNFASIQSLDVESLCYSERHVREFLMAFPSLEEIRLGFMPVVPPVETRVGHLTWKLLRRLSLKHIQSTENDLFNMFHNHAASLIDFYICDSYLTHGSWQSLLTRIKDDRLSVDIGVEGKLRESTKELVISKEQRSSLAKFFSNSAAPWPFR